MSASIALSAIALSEAEKAKELACQSVVGGYDSKTATTAEMRVYADCVKKLHPDDLSPGGVIVFKVCIVLVLLSMIWGAYKPPMTLWGKPNIEDRVFGLLAMPFIVGIGLFVIFMVLAGLAFVFK